MKNIIWFLITSLTLISCAQIKKQESINASDVIDSTILSRRSIRKYTDKKINRDIINQIMECGINAPNGRNRQAYEIRIIDDPNILNSISDSVLIDNQDLKKDKNCKSLFFDAPCVAFIANDTTYDVSMIDCGLLGENIILSAWSKGIGTCCMAHPIRLMKNSNSCNGFIKKMNFSKNYNLVYCITMGYPDESPSPKPRQKEKVEYVN